MQSLLRFLSSLGPFFLFVVLEVVCVYLIFSYNEGQRHAIISTTNQVTGWIVDRRSRMFNYARLRAINSQLLTENSELRNELSSVLAQRNVLPDSVAMTSDSTELHFIPARVIDNSITLRNNTLTIDKGEAHGIQEDLGVITDQGIVGIVRNVGKEYATVMSLLHSQTKIMGEIRGQGYYGTLSWPQKSDIRILEMAGIPQHVPLTVGDTVQTTDFSYLFPPELPIGTIEDFERDLESNFFRIQVRVLNDLGNVKYVYVVKHDKWEQLKAHYSAQGNE